MYQFFTSILQNVIHPSSNLDILNKPFWNGLVVSIFVPGLGIAAFGTLGKFKK